jgi:hypothetical protein
MQARSFVYQAALPAISVKGKLQRMKELSA